MEKEKSKKVVAEVINYFAEKVEELLKKEGREIKFDIVYENGKNGTKWDIEENGHLSSLEAVDENGEDIASIFINVDGRCTYWDYTLNRIVTGNTTLSKETLKDMGDAFNETYDWALKFDRVIATVKSCSDDIIINY